MLTRSQENIEKHVNFILQILDRQDLNYTQVNSYSEPGYTMPECGIVVLSNWYEYTQWNTRMSQFEAGEIHASRAADLLEQLGVTCVQETIWEVCNECAGLVRMQPDSHAWQPNFWREDTDPPICANCTMADPRNYLEHLEGQSRYAETIGLDLNKQGFVLLCDTFSAGLQQGANVRPRTIAKQLENAGIYRYIFQMDSMSQFTTQFSLWLHKAEPLELAQQALEV